MKTNETSRAVVLLALCLLVGGCQRNQSESDSDQSAKKPSQQSPRAIEYLVEVGEIMKLADPEISHVYVLKWSGDHLQGWVHKARNFAGNEQHPPPEKYKLPVKSIRKANFEGILAYHPESMIKECEINGVIVITLFGNRDQSEFVDCSIVTHAKMTAPDAGGTSNVVRKDLRIERPASVGTYLRGLGNTGDMFQLNSSFGGSNGFMEFAKIGWELEETVNRYR